MAEPHEHRRLRATQEGRADWKHWGPYLSERAWGTVREDYSEDGTAWEYLSHDHARSRAYRWNEDGLAGISDRAQFLCFALALWNGQDPILKERLFGLSGNEGNHGEDVKEIYHYLDSTPTHSYMKMLYRYPQGPFPYQQLVEENRHRGREVGEYELIDTGIFGGGRYFDVFVEYAKAGENDLLIRITVHNRGPEAAPLTLLPTLWFRNTWGWGYQDGPMLKMSAPPLLSISQEEESTILAEHPVLGKYHFYAEAPDELVFTENESNFSRLFGAPNPGAYVKDAFHSYVVEREHSAVNPQNAGTKAAAIFRKHIPAGGQVALHLRLANQPLVNPFDKFSARFARAITEADEFFQAIQAVSLGPEKRRIQRQAVAGMLWSKQLYYLDMQQWLEGDPGQPRPPVSRLTGRNYDWRHLNNFDILSMPDKWEYPWYAAWDLAFHCLPLAEVDAAFAKEQLLLLTRDWYMHPNGQLPAYEWAFGDVNPPVHAWAALRVYQTDIRRSGIPDTAFLKTVFHRMLLNFTWWVNKKDADGNNVFQGGFLGLDNISLFDRNASLPSGGHIDQSDGTAWMAFYSLCMLRIALELARNDPAYEDMAAKFYEHFLAIAVAMSDVFRGGLGLWDEKDAFYYDVLHLPDGKLQPLRVRSMVGLIPLLAVEVIPDEFLQKCPNFTRTMKWLARHRPHLNLNLAMYHPNNGEKQHLFSIVTPEKLRRILRYMLDEAEFLSPFGIRSLSRYHADHPFRLSIGESKFSIQYEPAESRTSVFGGNSNWRGPVWIPLNYLLIEALLKYYRYFGDNFKVEFPTGSGQMLTLRQVAEQLSSSLVGLFMPDANGYRPIHGDSEIFSSDENWRNNLLFHEYFHGDTGAGLGASHQTGWTGLVATLLQGDLFDEGEPL